MHFLMKNIWTLSCMVLILAMAFVGDASAAADGNTLLDTAKPKAKSVFTSVKTIIFIVGGFGLVGLAWAAIFGKVNWKWFAGLAVGLAILAAANAVVQYSAGTSAGLNDTFSQASSM